MFRNNIKMAFRNLVRQKGYSLINIVGLSIGIACTIFIVLYVQDELSYDRYHKNADRIFRVALEGSMGPQFISAAKSFLVMGPIFKREFPEVEKFVRMQAAFSELLIRYKPQKSFYEKKVFWAENSIFEIFNFTLVEGDLRTALVAPNSVVLAERAVKKYFGKDDPIGKALKIGTREYKVTGIMKEIPHNSHFTADFLLSFSTLGLRDDDVSNWMNANYYTYLLLSKNSNPKELEEKFTASIRNLFKPLLEKIGMTLTPGAKNSVTFKFYLQPLADIHLRSHLEGEIEANGDIGNVYSFITIAVLVLIIACINFINLSTARAAIRAKEVGVRKMAGANRRQLFNQFIAESFIHTLFAFLIALAFIELFISVVNNLAGKELSIGIIPNLVTLSVLVVIFLIVGFLSGSYPATYLSAFKPIDAIKTQFTPGRKGYSLRKILVVSQFVIAIVLITGTLIITNQLGYMRNKSLGFNKEQLLVMRIRDKKDRPKYESFKSELLKNRNILKISGSVNLPGLDYSTNTFGIESGIKANQMLIDSFEVDYDFIDTYGIKIVKGRNFSRAMTTDAKESVILNESAVKMLGWKDALDKKIIGYNEQLTPEKYTVIGVVRDFHYHEGGLHYKIRPLVLRLLEEDRGAYYITAKISTSDVSKTMSYVKDKFSEFMPDYPFDYFFLDSVFDAQYKEDERFAKVVGCFSGFAIFVACLGLIGLAAYAAERRTKEIGIRKAIGATTPEIIKLLVIEFVRWILLANLIACPLTIWLTNRWLQNFAYRVANTYPNYILAAVISFIVALLAVTYQALRAASVDPVKALRYE